MEDLETKPYGEGCPSSPRSIAADSSVWENWDYNEPSRGNPRRDLDIDEDYLLDEDHDEIGPRSRSAR